MMRFLRFVYRELADANLVESMLVGFGLALALLFLLALLPLRLHFHFWW